MKRIIHLKKLEWPFKGHPCVHTRRYFKSYWEKIEVDPCPCQPHDAEVVLEMVKMTERAFPIGFRPDYYILHFEMLERVNGWSDRKWNYNDETKKRWPFKPFIVLSGKRIPIHPAVTRYLVPHEYGHAVEHWITYTRGLKDYELLKEYGEVRRTKDSKAIYGSQTWSHDVGELFANDFRICIVSAECDFWQHPHHEHPLELPRVKDWWKKASKRWAA